MKSIVEKTKEHCIQLLTQNKCAKLLYHSVEHTLEVFEYVRIIGKHEEVSNHELDLLQIAALFHDTGVSVEYMGHEKISADIATQFLNDLGVPKEDISQVVKCILATKTPQNPKSQLERIICDADLFHLASKTFMLKNELLRAEWQHYLNLHFTNSEWRDLNLNFLKNHTYATSYGQKMLENGKNENRKLMNSLKESLDA